MIVIWAMCSLMALPSGASAWTAECGELACNSVPDTCVYASERPTYSGWGTLVHPGCRPVRWGGTYDYYTAWRWNGTRWQGVTIREGGRWYIWPYGSGWSWVWKAEYGWLAMRSEYALISRVYRTCPQCSIFT